MVRFRRNVHISSACATESPAVTYIHPTSTLMWTTCPLMKQIVSWDKQLDHKWLAFLLGRDTPPLCKWRPWNRLRHLFFILTMQLNSRGSFLQCVAGIWSHFCAAPGVFRTLLCELRAELIQQKFESSFNNPMLGSLSRFPLPRSWSDFWFLFILVWILLRDFCHALLPWLLSHQ